MAVVDYFLKLDGIDAGGTGPHKGEIQLDSFSWGVSNAATGGLPGKASPHDFDFVAKSTIASPKLMVACANGSHIQGAILSVFTSGIKGATTLLMTVKMKDLLVSSYQNSGSDSPSQPANVDDFPMDSVNLFYKELTFTFLNVTGSMGGPGTPT